MRRLFKPSVRRARAAMFAAAVLTGPIAQIGHATYYTWAGPNSIGWDDPSAWSASGSFQ